MLVVSICRHSILRLGFAKFTHNRFVLVLHYQWSTHTEISHWETSHIQASHWDIWNNPAIKYRPVIGTFGTTQPSYTDQSLGHLEQPSHHLFAQSQQ